MSKTIRNRSVTFRKPFTLPNVGQELPAGTYTVREETLASPPMKTDYLIIPDGAYGPDELGGSAMLNPGELEKAIAADQA